MRKMRVDDNQKRIVEGLRAMGITCAPSHDDILVGHKGATFWYEVKNPNTVSKKTGEVLESKIKSSQKKIRATWRGHYKIVTSIEEILFDLGVTTE
jgi:hypothetical protein